MGRQVVFTMVLIMAMMANKSLAGVNVVFNGSFENDGDMTPISIVNAPERWWDVNNIPSTQFSGYVLDSWSTHDDYSLTMYSFEWKEYEANDIATVSQDVYLADACEIIFDLSLETDWNQVWDRLERSAVVLIDDEVVWDSNSLGPDPRDNHYNQRIDIAGRYDEGPHKLSLGLRANRYQYLSNVVYRVRWDSIRFDTYCHGYGYLPPDFDGDCDVDWVDLEILANQWLPEQWSQQTIACNLFIDGEIDSSDLALFAYYWMADTTSGKYEQGEELLAMDLNNDGIVNLVDYAILTIDSDTPDYGNISQMADEWLLKSWLYGLQ